MSAFDVVSIGEPMVEFNQPRRGDPGYLQGFGGDSSNMSIAAARQGARTAYVTRLGDDEFGRMFLALWKEEGVDASRVIIDPQAHTAVYFVTHGEQGHVFSYLRAGRPRVAYVLPTSRKNFCARRDTCTRRASAWRFPNRPRKPCLPHSTSPGPQVRALRSTRICG